MVLLALCRVVDDPLGGLVLCTITQPQTIVMRNGRLVVEIAGCSTPPHVSIKSPRGQAGAHAN